MTRTRTSPAGAAPVREAVRRSGAAARPAVSPEPAAAREDLDGRVRRAELLGHRPGAFRITPAPSGIAPIQRRTLKDGEVRQWVVWATKRAAPNRQALMLAIYNAMRMELDLTDEERPAAIVAIPAARAFLIAQGKIDLEDHTALDTEAQRMQQANGDPAEASRLRITAEIVTKRPGIEARYANHIFAGDFNADHVPTGFHSKAVGSATHEAYGTITQLENRNANNVATYQQSVRETAVPGNTKPIQSTFFPDEATRDDILDGITSVYGAGLSQIGYVNARVNGLKLKKKGNTIFPAGGSDDRLAE